MRLVTFTHHNQIRIGMLIQVQTTTTGSGVVKGSTV